MRVQVVMLKGSKCTHPLRTLYKKPAVAGEEWLSLCAVNITPLSFSSFLPSLIWRRGSDNIWLFLSQTFLTKSPVWNESLLVRCFELFVLANPSSVHLHEFVAWGCRQIRASPNSVFLPTTKRGRRWRKTKAWWGWGEPKSIMKFYQIISFAQGWLR